MTLKIGNGFYDLLRRGKEPGSPSGHAVGLRQRPNENGPPLHFRNELYDIMVDGWRINQLVVAFVENANKVVLQSQTRNSLKHTGGINDPGWIVRSVENNPTCSRGDAAGELVDVNLKTVVHCGESHRGRTSQAHLFRQGNPIRGGN